MQDRPLGDLCVTFDPNTNCWAVVVCTGLGVHRPVNWFASRAAATEFALEEQARRTPSGVTIKIHFPGDCAYRCTFASPL